MFPYTLDMRLSLFLHLELWYWNNISFLLQTICITLNLTMYILMSIFQPFNFITYKCIQWYNYIWPFNKCFFSTMKKCITMILTRWRVLYYKYNSQWQVLSFKQHLRDDHPKHSLHCSLENPTCKTTQQGPWVLSTQP